MKAERRHVLQTNSLAVWIYNAPEFFKKHGSKLLLAVVLIALAAVLIQRYRTRGERELQAAADKLQLAEQFIDGIKMRPASIFPEDGISPIKTEALGMINSVLQDSKTPAVRAQARAMLGDYYLALANYPQPLGMEADPPEQSLNAAETAYQQVIKDTPNETLYVTTARFGLAAIEEARGYLLDQQRKASKAPADKNPHWDKARAYYETIVKDDRAIQAYRSQAKQRLQHVAELEKPVLIERAKPPTTTPSTTGPTTATTTLPIEPAATTRPATTLP